MQKLNLNEIHIKVTNADGYDVYINDIDNLKYRVIRAAHSVRNFSITFTTFHWSDKDALFNVRILSFDPKTLVLVKPEQPPCVRSIVIQNGTKENSLRKFAINGPRDSGCYELKKCSTVSKLKENQVDTVSLQDDLDDVLEYAKETPEETASAKKDFLNTYRSKHGIDYNYAVLIAKLFKSYIPESDSKKINDLLIDVYTLLNSNDIFDAEFRAGIPKIAKNVKEIVEKNLLEDHFLALVAKHPDHPSVVKAHNQKSLFDKMFDVLFALDKKLPSKKVKDVTFSVQLLDIRLSRVRSIMNYCKSHLEDKDQKLLDTYPMLQSDYKVKGTDEKEIESFVKAIEVNEAINILVHRLFKSLEDKSSNIRLHQALINRIQSAKKAKELFRAAYLTMDLKVLIEKWNESNAIPTKVPPLQV